MEYFYEVNNYKQLEGKCLRLTNKFIKFFQKIKY